MKPTLFKPLLTLSFLCFVISALMAEIPNTMSYQAIIRDAKEELVAEKTVKMRISILQGTISGDAVFVETHTTQTNINGLVAIEIGGGETISGNMAIIDWSAGPYFIKTETDIAGGENYSLVNTSQLLSVPYALHAKTADRALAGTEMSAIPVLTNEEIGSLTPGRGQMVLNITDDMLMIYSGSKWMPSSGGCWPQPNKANAGVNQFFVDNSIVSTFLDANNPNTGCVGKWNIVVGKDGVFEDDSNPKTKFTGILDQLYTLQWIISSDCGETSSSVKISFASIPPSPLEGSGVTDKDENTYKTVIIGNQEWMAENLRTTKYNDGTAIPYATDANQWGGLTTPAYCYYNNDTSYGNTYGALYNWYAVNTGILCPKGWHIPSDAEWTELENYLADNGYNYDGSRGGGSGKIGKAMASEGGWYSSSNTGAVGNTDYPEYRNKSDFSALPGGYRYVSGAFYGVGSYGSWWSSTEFSTNTAYYRYLGYDYARIFRDYYTEQYGFSVRCVRDK